VFAGWAQEGRLSFEYVLKMAEGSGVAISEKVAKLIVRKYGRRKDHLTPEDCLLVAQRRHSRSHSAPRTVSKSPKK
jgi:hypothetical protein